MAQEVFDDNDEKKLKKYYQKKYLQSPNMKVIKHKELTTAEVLTTTVGTAVGTAACVGIDLALAESVVVFASLGAGALVGGVGGILLFGGYKLWSDAKNAEAEKKLFASKLYCKKADRYNESLLEYKQTYMKYMKLNRGIKQEISGLNSEFAFERRNSTDSKVIVAIGPTGYGKSTFCNRMMNNHESIYDLDESANVLYPVAEMGDPKAKTFKLKKCSMKYNIHNKLITVTVVDTPGAFDTQNRDDMFKNQMAKYFRGSGGINVFCIFWKFGQKLTPAYKDLLKQYEIFFGGKEFWKHCVIIITYCDNDQNKNVIDKRNKHMPNIKQSVNQEIKNLINSDQIFKVYEFGENNFMKSRNNILMSLCDKDNYCFNKFECNDIHSPIDRLQAESVKTKKDLKEKIKGMTKLRKKTIKIMKTIK